MTLSFKEFRKNRTGTKIPTYNNFAFHWAREDTLQRQAALMTPHYQRFQQEHQSLDLQLLAEVGGAIDLRKTITATEEDPLKPLEPKLYDAYAIMSGYGTSDKELFA